MRKSVALILALAGIVALVVLTVSPDASKVDAQPTFSYVTFYGTVTVEGAPPEVGTLVRAKIRDKICGLAEVQDIEELGIGYTVDVKATTVERGCAGYGDTITFDWVDPFPEPVFLPCAQTGVWDPTKQHRLDLTCETPQTHTVDLWQGWNFVEWHPDGCKPVEDAFATLDVLDVAWQYEASDQSWRSYDPSAPQELNTLSEICSGDILIVHASDNVVWEQQ